MGGGSSLRVGVIGTGAVSQVVHVPIFSEREDVHLLAVADVETHKAETLSERFGAVSYTHLTLPTILLV